jgi:hypothetical protein
VGPGMISLHTTRLYVTGQIRSVLVRSDRVLGKVTQSAAVHTARASHEYNLMPPLHQSPCLLLTPLRPAPS